MIKPWFLPPPSSSIRHIAVIGAGIAGAACAWRFHQAGFPVSVFEKNSTIASEGSGNPMGIIEPYLTANHNVVDQFYTAAFHRIRAFLGEAIQSGVVHIAHTPEREERFQNLLMKRPALSELAQWLNSTEISQKMGVASDHPGLWLATAGIINPVHLCQELLKNSSVQVKTEIISIEYSGAEWELKDATGKMYTASHVIIANACSAKQFVQTQYYPLTPVPGQLTLLKPIEESKGLRHTACYEGYLTPAVNGRHVLGASYRHGNAALNINQKDHVQNIAYLQKAFPALATAFENQPCEGRVSVRAMTGDHLPLVGGVGDYEWYKNAYAKLHYGVPERRAQYPGATYLPNLFISAGFGSRGLTGSLLAADILFALIRGQALPLSEKVYQAIHPARFWIREITRKQI